MPDIVIPLEETGEAAQGEEHSRMIREKDLPRHLANPDQKKKKKEQQEEAEEEVAQRLATDNQLRAALFLLRQDEED